ncbi:fungal-specific transcription factor-like protein [Westerdykella ornata]|uniref:Fungal-specific transcription factor-like protein n=1 Tax=Westerdykella ornata TaxID=318751 RepID=A0A6A6JIH7_WESOR|nr:fungal-specific transcription factor-like protein [Westerdykella ornata]KAF2276045.1 fungal-specific transcription factor-like protein [Westerdykella ornata]
MISTSRANGGATMSPANETNTPSKRKSDDHMPQPRAKRNRYISLACNECKRRKIKCNGETPCQRCGNLGLECLYAPNCCNNFKDSDEFKQMSAKITTLQEQVEQLFANLNSLKAQTDAQSMGSIGTPFTADYPRSMSSMMQNPLIPPSPARERSRPHGKQHRFHGPTSSAFNLGVAKSSLQTMGITAPEEGEDEGALTQDVTPQGSPPQAIGIISRPALHMDKDPIWSLTKQDAIRLIRVWHEEMGLMYPFLDIEEVVRYAERLFSFTEAAARSGFAQLGKPGADEIMDDQTSNLKLVLAISLILEGGGKDPLGERLFDNVHKRVEKTLSAPVDIQGINMLILTGMYHFHQDNEPLAWRLIGLAVRQCFELGLHRRETYDIIFTNAAERAAAVRTFWSVYVLDRRWSFGTGMPFAMQEADIDPNLPKPDEDNPYLSAMIAYSGIASKVWRSVANPDASQNHIRKEDVGFLDFQVLNWHRNIPESLRFVHPESGRTPEPASRGLRRLQVALYLRANQMRILIYRPVLHSATSIMKHLDFAETVVTIAKDTIRVLTHINQTSDLYRTQQTMFNYFLISALAVLFLAVAHAPAQFSAQCRDEFYMALDIVRGLSSNSYVSKRLWKTIKMLKEVGPSLGLNVSNVDTADAHSSAAVAMAGLAGHQVDELAIFSHVRNGQHTDTPHGMASDLTSLFEAAGGYSSTMLQNGYGLTSGEIPASGEFVTALGQEDELARIMRDLF